MQPLSSASLRFFKSAVFLLYHKHPRKVCLKPFFCIFLIAIIQKYIIDVTEEHYHVKYRMIMLLNNKNVERRYIEMKHYSLLTRFLILFAGLLIMAFGVAFSIKAGLGTSPISSLPYVISLIAPLSVGTATIIMHCVLILLQILLLRKKFELIQLTQLPVAIIFGYLTDFAVWALRPISVSSYPDSLCLCLMGILLVGTGVSFEVNASLVTLAGEGMVLAVCRTFNLPFAKGKTGFDCTLVFLASVLSILFLGYLAGVREGTAAAAILVGVTSKAVTRKLFVKTEPARQN